jgi:hypothetical protein
MGGAIEWAHWSACGQEGTVERDPVNVSNLR